MKLSELLQSLNDKPRPPAAPAYIIWMPPSGAPVECPPGMDIVQIGRAASKIAAANPGRMVAVYSVVGTAYAPVVEPPYTPTTPQDDPLFTEQISTTSMPQDVVEPGQGLSSPAVR